MSKEVEANSIIRTILSTEREPILLEKTKLKADFDFDRELENQDVEEELEWMI